MWEDLRAWNGQQPSGHTNAEQQPHMNAGSSTNGTAKKPVVYFLQAAR